MRRGFDIAQASAHVIPAVLTPVTDIGDHEVSVADRICHNILAV